MVGRETNHFFGLIITLSGLTQMKKNCLLTEVACSPWPNVDCLLFTELFAYYVMFCAASVEVSHGVEMVTFTRGTNGPHDARQSLENISQNSSQGNFQSSNFF